MSCRPEDGAGFVLDRVGRFALELHHQRSENLTVEDDSALYIEDDGQEPPRWTVQGNRLLFSSLSARNQCAALQF